MPIYEYRCDNCDHQLEALQRISDALLTDCPECAEPKLKKLISAVGFRLAGSGWYETDFKSGDKKKNLAGDKDAKKDPKSSNKDNQKVGQNADQKGGKTASGNSTKTAKKADAKPAKAKTTSA